MLQSLADCDHALHDDWEVLVVNNGREHNTDSVVQTFAGCLPVRVVQEQRAGLSHARNCGSVQSRGQWLIWTDDDVTVCPGWLREYRSAITQFPDARVLGGPISPQFEGDPPAWLIDGQRHIRSAFASRNANDVDDEFEAAGPLPYGANFAIRKTDALQFPFDPELGRHPRRPTRGWEEVFVIRRILAGNGKGRWLRNATVTHHIDQARQTAAFIRSYYFDVGFVGSMHRAHRVRRRRALAKLVQALRLAVRHEAGLAKARSDTHGAAHASALRSAAQNWGHARAWFIAMTSARAVASWRDRSDG